MANNEDFIIQHRLDDVRTLALKKGPEGIDMPWCLQQIEGWQIARRKLQRWANADRQLWFPPKISMEQCSSEQTALYKQQLTERLLAPDQRNHLVDITGGFGIDFSYMSASFQKATYIERQEHLCNIASHNFPLLGLNNAKVIQDDSTAVDIQADIIFADPARRDESGKKTVAIEDCTPNINEMQDRLLARTRYLIIKFSPMLDIAQALRTLRHVTEIHIISVKGECKELLLVLKGGSEEETHDEELRYFCVNLDSDDTTLSCTEEERHASPQILQEEEAGQLPSFLFEPNSSVLKAGCQDILCKLYGIKKLHPCSNLFVGHSGIGHFPGRQFTITAYSDFGKKGLKTLLKDVQQANLTIRNFPASVAELRKKLKLREGGDVYLFATTMCNGSHVLIRCTK